SCPLCPGRHTCYNGWDKGPRSREGDITPKTRPQFGLQAATRLHEGGIGRFRFCACFKQFCLLHITISLDDRFIGFVVNLIGYFQLRKSIVQTTLKGRAFPINIGTFVPKTIVSPIIAPLGCKIYLFSPSPYCMRQMYAFRLGSYSMVTIIPDMSF
ncbi:hypothetical protein ZWY2020_008713, partial [Hordeum vulgare]